MYAALKLQGLNKLLDYRFLAHGITSVSYSQRGSDTNRCGTPAQSDRFTLHYQPRDQVFWQCSTYWYRNNFFNNNYTSTKVRAYKLLLGMAAHLVRQHYQHYLCHISGPRYDRQRTLRQRNNGVMELHSTGTLLGHTIVRKVRDTRISRYGFSFIWHDTPGQYIECTCKLTAAKSSGQTI